MFKDYYQLAKPGLIFGNIVTVVGGFALAARGRIGFWLFTATLIGILFVMASGCVFNNYIDRDIDRKMERTRDRALARGRISARGALAYGACLGFLGMLTFSFYTNVLATQIAFIGFFFYVFMYSSSRLELSLVRLEMYPYQPFSH